MSSFVIVHYEDHAVIYRKNGMTPLKKKEWERLRQRIDKFYKMQPLFLNCNIVHNKGFGEFEDDKHGTTNLEEV